jgi:hypothetical protein
MKIFNMKKRFFAAAGLVGVTASNALAVYTAPTDVAGLWTIIDLSGIQTQMLVMYGLGLLITLTTIIFLLVRRVGKRAARG